MTDAAMRFNELAAKAEGMASFADDLEVVHGPCMASSAQRIRSSKLRDMARAQINRLDPPQRRYAEARLKMLTDRLDLPGPGEWRIVP
jgi:hypothetical protein